MDENKIQLFENKRIRTEWNEEREEWLFSVSDVVEVLTDSTDVKQYVKKMRNRDPEINSRWGTICTLTAMTAADGKRYRTTATNAEGILRISACSRISGIGRRWRLQSQRHSRKYLILISRCCL